MFSLTTRCQDIVPGLGHLEGLGQQVAEVENLDVTIGQHACELIVLLLGPLEPQDVIEQKMILVLRGEPEHLTPGLCRMTCRSLPISESTEDP